MSMGLLLRRKVEESASEAADVERKYSVKAPAHRPQPKARSPRPLIVYEAN
jgi:hypothetical protein